MIYKASVLLSKIKKNTNHGLFFEIDVTAALISAPWFVRFPIPQIFHPFYAFNDEKTELALTSRRCRLLTFILVDPTSRSWDVTTWGRRDVSYCSKIASKSCPFRTNCTYIQTNYTNQILSYKITYLNVK